MPVMVYGPTSVAANTKVAGLFSGQLHEYIAQRSLVSIYSAGSATGLNLTANIGGSVVINDQVISAANRYPVRPDDLIYQGGAVRGDRIVCDLRNTTAGALTGWIVVDITPV